MVQLKCTMALLFNEKMWLCFYIKPDGIQLWELSVTRDEKQAPDFTVNSAQTEAI